MAKFELALQYVFDSEGVDNPAKPDPDDPGGATAYGITHGVLAEHKKKHGSECPLAGTSIVELDRAGAEHVYRFEFWQPQYDALTSQRLATKLFDAAVNLHPYWSTVCLQRALNTLRVVPPLATDGKFGARTAQACNVVPTELVLDELVAELSRYYVRVTKARLQKYLPIEHHSAVQRAMKYQEGWIVRAAKKPSPAVDK